MEEEQTKKPKQGDFAAAYKAPIDPPVVVPEAPPPTAPETPMTEVPKVALSPSMEIEAGRLADAEAARLAASRAESERILAEEREAEEREAPPPPAPQKRWCWLSTSCLGLIILLLFCAVVVGAVTVWWVKKYPIVTGSGKPTIATVTTPAPTVPAPVVTPRTVAAPPAFTGTPGNIVCRSARLMAPTACDTAGLHLLRERPDWVQPAYLCNETAMHGSDLCDCLVCKRIP